MAGWAPVKELLELEIRQRAEEGCDVDAEEWRARLAAFSPADSITPVGSAERGEHADRAGSAERVTPDKRVDCATLESLYDELASLSLPVDLPYREPSDIEEIRALRPDGPRDLNPAFEGRTLFERILGGWVGRCCGCSLGRPFGADPFLRHAKGRQRHEIQRWLEGADAWPLADYAPEKSRASVRGLQIVCPESTGETIRAMEPDENTDATLLALKTVEDRGLDFRTSDVARTWLDLLPFTQTRMAQTQAFVNLIGGEGLVVREGLAEGLESVDWQRVATHRNPYREWNDGRARADVYGYLSPGRPEQAAELAWRDARITHDKNGLYAAMFAAAVVAAAFCGRDPRALVQIGLSEIPAPSRLSSAVRKTLDLCDKYLDWPDCWDEAMAVAGSYDAHHAIPNLLAVVIALVYGRGDFEKSICIAVSEGLDAPANGATVGSILGAFNGSRALPAKWVSPLSNTLKSRLPAYARTTIGDAARRCLAILEKTPKH